MLIRAIGGDYEKELRIWLFSDRGARWCEGIYEIVIHYFVFVIQKHLKLVFVFSNSLPGLVRTKWWKQNPKTHPNKHLLRGTYLFWVMSDENPQIQTTPKSPLLKQS